jgi:PAC2 family protein
VLRPLVQVKDNRREITWPEILIFLANKKGANRDLLLLIGSEPHLRWPAFTRAISQYLQNLGVQLIVNLRSFPAPIPHTRPATIFPASSDMELASQFAPARQGFKFEGLTDVAEVLSAEVDAWGCATVDLSVLQPYYFRPMPRAEASIAVIKALDRVFGGETDISALKEASLQEGSAIDAFTKDDEEMVAMVRAIEREFDESPLWRPDSLSGEAGELPSAEAVVGEIERLLREHSDPGSSAD